MKVFAFCFLLHFSLFMALFLMGLDFSGIDGHEPGLVSRSARALAEVLGPPPLHHRQSVILILT